MADSSSDSNSAALKRSLVGAAASDESEMKRQCMRGSSREEDSFKAVAAGVEGVLTSLTLSPPGEKVENEVVLKGEEEEEEDDDNHEEEAVDDTVEMEETCLMTMMQRMIAQEVRNYIDSLRAENGLAFGLQPAVQNNPKC